MSLNPKASLMTESHDVAPETAAVPSTREQGLGEAIEAIRRDSVMAAEQYLKESIAPYGGE